MSSKHFFNIILPTFNRLNFLKEAIISVQKQTFIDWELHIIDNSSTDGTIEYLKTLKYDKRIRYSTINNQGIIAKSRNYGLRNANSKAISFLDDDDIWLPNKLEQDFKLLNNDNQLVYSKVAAFQNNNRNTKKSILPVRLLGDKPLKNMLQYGNTFITSSVSYLITERTRSLYFNESKSMITWEDYDLWIKLISNGVIPKLNNNISVLYRVSDMQNTKPERELKNINLIAIYHKFAYIENNINTINSYPLWACYDQMRLNLIKKRELLAFKSLVKTLILSLKIFNLKYALKSILRYIISYLTNYL